MSVVSGLLLLVGSSLLLWLVLLGIALARKLRRDRRESRSVERRALYERVLATGDASAIAAIFSGARDVEAQVDLAVTIDALHRTLSPADFGAMPALIAALSSEVWAVRAQAAKSLGALGAIDALHPLERCLSDQAWWVRANAARALYELGDPGLEALRRAVEHEDRYAADRAREQLALHAVVEARVAA